MRDQNGSKRNGGRGGIAREEKQACTYKRKIRMCEIRMEEKEMEGEVV